MLDIERIIQTGIPDIAPVYGGVRGRTLSSHKQAYAWKTVVAAGIRLVIDLRKDYTSDKYSELCRQFGVDYFHYPIDNDRETIAQMVKLFPLFCEKIDQGDFYIACAMGLHRTDIALCTYWVFHAADKGISPPSIRGYRQKNGHNTDKIMRMLNAFYQYMTERDSKEPMPIEVFKERKEVIIDLSRDVKEGYIETHRKSNQLVDYFDPDTNTLDIQFNGKYPSNVLSNLCSNGFRFEGMVCSSMEGFLQSLKQKDKDKQRQICSMKGGNARKQSVTSWQTDQILWWKGQAYNRQGEEYLKLIRRAYQAMFDQCERFRAALMTTCGITLISSGSEENPCKTILTEQEFCQILTNMRDS